MSHSSQSDAADMIARVRTISESVAILVDTRGPEVRTTAVDEPIDFVVGQAVRLSGEEGVSTQMKSRSITLVLSERWNQRVKSW